MPYFMEFSRAVGMHAGYLPGYPASHGCVRMPRDLAALFFQWVQIWNTSHGRRQHAQPGSRPKGHADTAQRFICVGSALIGSNDQPGVGRSHWTKVQ
jgi:L,D-transpeptidase catalytic domain